MKQLFLDLKKTVVMSLFNMQFSLSQLPLQMTSDIPFWQMSLGIFVPFLLGIIFGKIIWGGHKATLQDLREELEKLRGENAQLNNRVADLQISLNETSDDLKTSTAQLTVSRGLQSNLESDLFEKNKK